MNGGKKCLREEIESSSISQLSGKNSLCLAEPEIVSSTAKSATNSQLILAIVFSGHRQLAIE